MFQQAELDNYKLQVELLQKKLERSEEQRQHLEDKYEKIQKKRNEHEKSIKTKSRIKFEEFLEEQRERNERNKTIVKMLENIDQQASTLATRTERLKIMKLQYELYFAKLLQSHAMRSLQNSPRYSILPINQMQSHQSVVYPTIPVQSAGISTIPLNPTIPSTNIYQNQENFPQQRLPTMTAVNLPNSGPDNWNTILMANPNNNPTQITQIPANYFHHPGNDIMYRYPNQMDYYNGGQILLNQNTLNQIPTAVSVGPNQLGLPIRSNTVPLMSPSDFHDSLNNPILSLHQNNSNYPNQIHGQQPQRNPNKYTTKNNISDRDELDNNEDCKFYDQNTPMSDRDQLKLNQFRKLQENFKSNEKPLKHQQISKNKNQFDFGKSHSDSDRDDDNDEPYKNNPDIFYRKDPISLDKAKDQLSPVNKTNTGKSPSTLQNSHDNLDDDKIVADVIAKPVEKSPPINLSIRITDAPKQKLNENNFTSTELQEQQPELRQYEAFDKIQRISSQLETNKEPVNWNFNGRNHQLSSQADQFAKKEKISIENIENAIYGELISPERQILKNFIPVETLKNQVRPEPLNFKEVIERENYHEEKSDSSSEKAVIIDNPISPNKANLVSPKHQIISNQTLNKNDKDDNLRAPQNQQNVYDNNIKLSQNLPNNPNISNEISNIPPKQSNVANEPPMILQNQKVAEENTQNYDNQYFSEPTVNIQKSNSTTNDSTYDNYNNYQQDPEPTAEYSPTENIVQNYETDVTQSFAQPVDVQENLDRIVAPTIQNQDVYENQQYDQNYQYQTDQNYPQQEYTEQDQQQNPDVYSENYMQNVNADFQNYPNQEYQAAYDPNNYEYNYDQQQTYQDPNQQYLTEQYDPNYQPEVASENYQNYDQPQTDDIMPQSEIVPPVESYLPTTEPLEQNPIIDKPEINQAVQPLESNINESNSLEDTVIPNPIPPPAKVIVKPILSKDKSVDLDSKKKKKVNFVDSSETDSSSSASKQDIVPSNNDESDFDFSSTN